MHKSTTVRTHEYSVVLQAFNKSPDEHTGHYFPHQIIKGYIFRGRTRPEPVCGLQLHRFYISKQQQYCKYSKGADFVNKWLISCIN